MSWDIVKLSEVTDSITDGDHQPAPKSDTGVWFIKIKDIINNQISLENALHVPLEYYKRIPAIKKAVNGDVLYTVVGSYGIPVFVNADYDFCFERNIALLRPNARIEPRYLYYAMKNPMFFEQAKQIANGSAQKLIPLSKLGNMTIVLPPLQIQKTIVETLSGYDKLISNNQKQIKLLEEAAQRLYKEWFVDLRFPGHETTKITDGIPEGWKKRPIESLIKTEIGGGWGEDEVTPKCTEPAYVVRGTDLFGITHGDYLNIPFRFHAKTNLSARELVNGDIVFEVSGGSKTEGVAKTCLITGIFLKQFGCPVMCASFCKKIRPIEKVSQYLYDTFQYMRSCGKTAEYDKKSASSIVNYRWKDFLSKETVVLPPEGLLERYNALAKAIYNEIQTESVSIVTAKRTRDYLLPKLMNCEIEV